MKKIIVFLCVILSIIVVAALTMPALLNNSDEPTGGENASSEQVLNESLVVKNVLNPLNVEVEAVEKLPAEDVLKALAAEAKSNVEKSTSFELELKETAEFFSLDHVLRYYNAGRNADEYLSEKASDVVNIDITAGKGNEDDIQAAEYMTFLAFLFNTYPDCVAFIDYKYFDYNYNRMFFPILLFCPDYAEYGYDTIYDYLEAVRSGEETRYENAYEIWYNTNRILPWGADKDDNLFNELFENTVSK